MQSFKFPLLVLLAALPLAACAPQAERIASASAAERTEPVWAFESSDIPVDPGFRFRTLANGMRYVIRANATPPGTAIVRMEIDTGSLDEEDDELGFAHFVEHMAFNGSTRVPEGEMVRLLERHGLAFGADTNAATSFDRTTYRLDLPQADPQLIDIALMLMRETVSELTFSPEAVERERGVVLSEMRDRNTYALRDAIDSTRFLHRGARYGERFPIGTLETLQAATAEGLKAFWAREYVPEHTTLVVIGDFDPALVEAEIVKHFVNWQAAPAEPQPDGGPVRFGDRGRTGIHLDPALPERITATRNGPWLDEPDTIAQRQENLLRQIGYSIVNRRLQRLSRLGDPPFRGAGFGTGEVFEAGRSTRLIVDTADRKWQRGLTAAIREYRRALGYGFTEAEVAEQVANIRTSAENAAAAADTRSHQQLANAVFRLLRTDLVPAHPQAALDRFEAFAPEIAPESVLAALQREAIPLEEPLLRFRGRIAPEGGEEAIRAAWNDAMDMPLAQEDEAELADFSYTDFGEPGAIVSDTREPQLGIRMVRFANGVMLNLKRTELERDKVRVALAIDGGKKLDTPENPLGTELTAYLTRGGLGRHSLDELQTILAGRTVSGHFSLAQDSFVSRAHTTPRDLPLQLRLLTAYITDPGYRPEGEVQYRHSINNYFAQLTATPSSALRSRMGGIFSDNDPRFSLHAVEQYRSLTYADLQTTIGERLAEGALEIGIVGDIDENRAIVLVAQTFGALPARETGFRSYDQQPPRTFTADRSQRIVRHTGPGNQALLRLTWPTRDDSDPLDTLKLELLERVVRVELTDTLREALGKAYSPRAASSPSRSWEGYGTFGIAAPVDVADVQETRAAVRQALTDLRSKPIDEDLLRRARQPLIETYQNALKSNAGWLALVGRAQTEHERIERLVKARDRLLSLTSTDVEQTARRYLDPGTALEILVLPEGIEVPED